MSLIVSKSNVRINDLARELAIKSRRVLEFLHKRGVHGYTHTSWVDSSLAGELRAEFSDPPWKSEREIRIEQGVIRPRAGGDAGPAPTPVCAQAPHLGVKKKKKTAKKRQQATKRAKPVTKVQPVRRHSLRQELRGHLVFPLMVFPPMPEFTPPLPREELCHECRLLVHPAVMEQHMLDHHAHPKLPDLKTAQFSFVILPPGHDWDYRTVLQHYQRLSRSHNFNHNAIDWTRIEKIERHLKAKLKNFGVRGWFGYGVYEFPYTNRIVLECPMEGNTTYILWGDWHNRIQLSKGELRHRYPNQHIRVIHHGDWIEDVGRALKGR